MAFPSSLPVASALVYPSRTTDAGRKARDFVVYRIKQDRPVSPDGTLAIEYSVDRFVKSIAGTDLAAYFENLTWLVPIPRHSLHQKGALWPSLRIAEAIHAQGIGERIEPCVVRTQAVRKSSFARPGERPTPKADHYPSLSFAEEMGSLLTPSRILLIDDVVTRGATMIAAAAHLSEAFATPPEISAFALARTESGTEIQTPSEMFSPKLERITYDERWDTPSRV